MAPTNLEKAEHERQSQKTMLEHFKSELNRHTTQALSQVEIQHYLDELTTLRNEHMETHRKILNSAAAGTDMGPHETECKNILLELSKVTCGFKALRVIASPAAPAGTGSGAPEVRLPRIELPTFNGDLNQWLSFKDLFVSTVHDNTKISEAQKLTYLKSTLTGDAANLVKSMASTDANYSIAWKMLQERFQNKRELVFTILRRFSDQPACQGKSATALRSLVDVSKECIRSLEALTIPVNHWDIILVFYILQKVDVLTRQLWEMSLPDTDVPKLDAFLDFLEQRARALSSGGICDKSKEPAKTQQHKQGSGSPAQTRKTFVHHANQSTCKVCGGDHLLFTCSTFIGLSVPERRQAVQSQSLCFNCFRSDHQVSKCSSDKRCKSCNGKHHSLLHMQTGSQDTREENAFPVLTHHADGSQSGQSMLATAIVKIMDRFNEPKLCRAFLDGGATSSFITEECANRLGLSRSRASADVVGIAASNVGKTKGSLTTNILPYFHIPGNESFNVTMLVLPTITTKLPTQYCEPEAWPHLHGIQLADPSYFKPAKIDILLGSDIFWSLLKDGRKTGQPGSPMGISSKLGWLVAGNVSLTSPNIVAHHTQVDIGEQLQRFWELESVPESRVFTKEEEECEQHFQSTTTRDETGRYTVSLPFKKSTKPIGASRDIASRRLRSLERRLERNPNHRKQYVDFMQEYIQLGHMELVTAQNSTSSIELPGQPHFIPHHFVEKESSTTTKFRVVFDASAKTSSGISLNSNLLVGPTLQDNLADILMRFRLHVIAFTADIAKMYRQVLVNKLDLDWQRILWRFNPKEEIQEYRLLTVTYGTASAPYHAVRVLKKLAEDESQDLPLGSEIASKDFYVDDLMSGGPTVEEAVTRQSQIIELARRGQMELRKFSSNHPALLSALPPELRETKLPLSMDKDDTVKTLGLHWNPGMDVFNFKVNLPLINESTVTTKRELLSQMSKVFDPLGWLSPTIIKAKIMFQQMWSIDADWDDPLPATIQQQWSRFRYELPLIEKLNIPRCIKPSGTTDMTLHGFCDASERAFAAVIYTRAEIEDEDPVVSIVASKTRVAPSKIVSLPRLELCGAVLLTKLMKTVKSSLNQPFSNIYSWTDSTAVLGWIQGHPSRWKTFVANRVTEIQNFEDVTWGHVRGTNNPADCASRGIDPSELCHPLWWHGPDFIQTKIYSPDLEIPAPDYEVIDKELRKVIVSHATTIDPSSFLFKCSSLRKLQKITAWCLRFFWNCKTRVQARKSSSSPVDICQGPLTTTELDSALISWVKIVQQSDFSVEIHRLKLSQPLPKKSKLRTLNPFLDSQHVLRVGGRLRNAPLSTDQKTPIVLPRHSYLTRLVINHEHQRNLHGGAQLLLAIIQNRFWIIGAKDAIRREVGSCVICTRHRASTLQQVMGDLPAVRVTPTRPFLTCGVDYAGPFTVRAIPGRSKVTFKAYLALFICFSTRAVHLEVVSSMTTDAFLAALRRFVSRRGRCRDIYSDCGSNFVGAARELKEFLAFIRSKDHNHAVSNHLSNDGMQWHFNPPGAPHFGGLWEAGVKSTKFHLHRVVGPARLTFEELSTVMTQVEACLNSRPLTPVSSDVNDLTALTPGHFLIGESLVAVPEPDLTKEKVNRLTRWQTVQQLSQHFWRRWSREYLSRLQQRPKWVKHCDKIDVGKMVIIKDDNLPPLKWRLGRILLTHPGLDGIVRVATLKTADGEIKRPITKLCLLPIEHNETQPTTE